MKRALLCSCAIVGTSLFMLTPAFAEGRCWPWWPPHSVPEPDTFILLASGVSAVVGAWQIKKVMKR